MGRIYLGIAIIMIGMLMGFINGDSIHVKFIVAGGMTLAASTYIMEGGRNE